jgi:D-3-phosphoglycerate dehydrogenase
LTPSAPPLALDNAVCVPHLGYVERSGLAHMFSTIFIFDQMRADASGAPINVVNPEVLSAHARTRAYVDQR